MPNAFIPPFPIPQGVQVKRITPALAKLAFPTPPKNANKGTFGRAAIFAGSDT